jgi:flagellin-specific chaperone FliS
MDVASAYKNAQSLPKSRIDTIIALYRKALSHLDRARATLLSNDSSAATTHLLKTQTIVMALASNLPAYKDEAAINFLRLYEFVAYQMKRGGVANVDAAAKVLRILLTGFEAKREQALALELQGKLPPVDAISNVSLTA